MVYKEKRVMLDKIYVSAQWKPNEEKDVYYASAVKTSHPRETEYIRKDKILAVLETFSNPTTELFVRSIIESLSKIN